MIGGLVYFSGTGNTEYVMEKFKQEFNNKGIETELINTNNEDGLKKEYDFYIFGAPIHSEMFPNCYISWVKDNIKEVSGKKCIIVSTQASKTGTGVRELNDILKNKKMNVVIQDFIEMPNNYYVVMFKKNSKEEIDKIKKLADDKVREIVDSFIVEKTVINKVSKSRLVMGKLVYSLFIKCYSKKWALKNLTVDKDLCIKCKKCENECPTDNIKFHKDEISFNKECISCQHCIHMCPVNAFRYKGKEIEQYKI